MNRTKPLMVSGSNLTLEAIHQVARCGQKVGLAPSSFDGIAASRRVIEEALARGVAVYGVNTGFGKLADISIALDQVCNLQVNLVRSHACGLGKPLSEPETRAMLLLRANVLAKGLSGVRRETVEMLIELLNAGVRPVVPEKGSVGASGDLAPLAHLALVLIGEGEAFYRGKLMSGAEALQRAKLAPIHLQAKEGLALLNGTQAMTAGPCAASRCTPTIVSKSPQPENLRLPPKPRHLPLGVVAMTLLRRLQKLLPVTSRQRLRRLLIAERRQRTCARSIFSSNCLVSSTSPSSNICRARWLMRS